MHWHRHYTLSPTPPPSEWEGKVYTRTGEGLGRGRSARRPWPAAEGGKSLTLERGIAPFNILYYLKTCW
jgi:hypothetical protein